MYLESLQDKLNKSTNGNISVSLKKNYVKSAACLHFLICLDQRIH